MEKETFDELVLQTGISIYNMEFFVKQSPILPLSYLLQKAEELSKLSGYQKVDL